MDFVFILVAFVCGVGLKLAGMPPLIGYLGAGFLLHYLGYEANQTLETLANLGITLMLFTIGLKLNIRDLLKTEVLIGCSAHMIIWCVLSGLCFMLLGTLGISLFSDMSPATVAMLSFALSFSSTVCIVKILEESGELKTRHGKLAIGILVVQDIFAVMFMVLATGATPTLYALLLLLLIPFKPVLGKLLEKSGHGELLPLTGFVFALGGYELFSAVGIKGDLGALLLGMLLASHFKATELSKALLSFKDLFLMGFFLSIGFSALPTFAMIVGALIIATLLPLKFSLFMVLFSRLRLRIRTAYLASLVLGNYSEFGLIVVSVLVSAGMLAADWLVVLALSVSFSFVLTSVVYRTSHKQYAGLKDRLKHYEHPRRLAEDEYQQPKGARVLILGMGRVGKGAYLSLQSQIGQEVWGIDADPVRVRKLVRQNMQVLMGDGEDADFWENTQLSKVQLVMLAVPSTEDISNITEQLRSHGFGGKIAAIARYEDEIQPLLDAGIDQVFNFFTEAGTGFAEESLQLIQPVAN